MANICTNLVYAELLTKENSDYFLKWLDDNFSSYDIDTVDEYSYDIILDSRWGFPEEVFKELTDGLPNKDVYIRCLSYEMACYYHSLWVYDDKSWKEL